MNKILKYSSFTLGLLIADIFSYVGATNLHVSLPDGQGYQDIQRATQGQTEITSNPDDVIGLIKLINEYLWIAIGVACMFVLVMGGIKLVTARGDEAAMKKAGSTMSGAVIGIAIAIFAYLIVRAALNLF